MFNDCGRKAPRKSTEVKYAPCGCCPAGLVVYPESIGDVLSTNCHQAFTENFEMFLRKQKDRNTQPSWYFKLKHQQRMDFACMTARFCKGASEESEKRGAYLLSRIANWAGDLLEGFEGAETLIAHLKDLANGVSRKLTSRVMGENIVIHQPSIRPGEPGFQITVPLKTLENLQPGQGIPTGQPGHLLVKVETGSRYQIVRVGPTDTQPTTPSSSPVSLPAVVTSDATQPSTTSLPVSSAPDSSSASTAAASASAASIGKSMTPDMAKVKCRNFLTTLLRLTTNDQPELVARNVRMFIQELIDGKVEPEVFTAKIQKELNSSPQPCLNTFLKKSLPYLQHSLATGELGIEGIIPPAINQVGKLPAAGGSASILRVPVDISIISEESYKDVKDLAISAHKWVVEQLDVALQEFKQFRDGLEENEREKYDKLVQQQNEKWRDFDLGNLGFEELDVSIKEIQKEMDGIIARNNNKNKDVDSLVELIEGKKLGAIRKKKKEKANKCKTKKKLEKKCKDKNDENRSEKDIITQQSDEKLEQLKCEMAIILNGIQNVKSDDVNVSFFAKEKMVDELKMKKEKASTSKNKKNQDKKCKDANNNENSGEKDISTTQQLDEVEQFKREALITSIQNVKSDDEKDSLSNQAKMADELNKAMQDLDISKNKLKETENQLREERSKNSHKKDELNKAMQDLNITKAKLKETESQLTEERSKNVHENDLLRSRLLFNDFKKHRDVLRQRQKNNFSVIDHLRESPELVKTPEVQQALRSLHEFSARLLLADQELSLQYTTLCQQVQTSNTIPELFFDISDTEPPELGSSCMNLLYRSILMSQTTAALPSSLTSPPLGSSLPTSRSTNGTPASVRSSNFSDSLLPTGSIGSFVTNGATATSFRSTAATTKNVKQTDNQNKYCAPSKQANKITNAFQERGGGDASVNPADTDCSICFEAMDESDSFFLKLCQHRFHRACMKQWLESPKGVSFNCPMCRTRIAKVDDVRNLGAKRRF